MLHTPTLSTSCIAGIKTNLTIYWLILPIILGISFLTKQAPTGHIILIIAFYIYARGQQKKSPKVEKIVQEEEKYDGFDSLRKKEKLKTEYEQILEGTDEKDEDKNKK